MEIKAEDKIDMAREYCVRLLFNSARKFIFIGFIFATVLVIVLLSDYRPFNISCSEEKAEKINDLILALSYSYIASFIFFLVQDYLPKYRSKKSTMEYVQGQIAYIHQLLREEIERQFFFEIPVRTDWKVEAYVNKFAEDDLFSPMKELGGKSRYDVLRNDEKRIKEIAKELLRLYGEYLNYDEVKQLEYLNKEYKIDPLLSSHLTELNGEVGIDDRFIRAQAVEIYKAYDIMRQKRFDVPRYPIEDELYQEFGFTESDHKSSHRDMS